jgi:glycosyltransferase involved in cell wall biosynthesis
MTRAVPPRTRSASLTVLLVGHAPLRGSGAGTYMGAVARHLRAAGHRPVIFTPGTRNRLHRWEGIKHYEMRLAVTGLKPGLFPNYTAHPLSELTFAALTSEQIEDYVAQFRDGIAQVVRAERPTVIHAQHLSLVALAASSADVPLVVTSHGTELQFSLRHAQQPWAQVVIEVLRRSQGTVFVSNYTRELAMRVAGGPLAARSVVILNGYDPVTFHPRQLDKVGRRVRPLIVAAGRFVDYKRLDLVISAAAEFARSAGGPEHVEVVVAGDGPLRTTLQTMALESGLRAVRFPGFVRAAVLAGLLRRADAFVMPSEFEPFGLVALEAAACGAAVLASNSGGPPEFIGPEVGKLVDGWNPTAWAAGLERTLGRSCPRQQSGRPVHNSVHDLTWSRHSLCLLDVYMAAVG